MEGKGVLFKRFAGIDVFDLEVDAEEPAALIETVERLQGGFGGINLEDISAPDCFEVEAELKRRCEIPVMHDDQHGTAIISGAALLNALELAGKRIEEVRVVFIGAGAAGIASARFYRSLGVKGENLVMVDVRGVIRSDNVEPGEPAAELATQRDLTTLGQALDGADVMVGLSAGGLITADHLARMAKNPIIFALANPTPEIEYEEARAARPDAIVATGRSDVPNQVNNVLGFPYIFRGALDVGAREINEEMKIAATRALARLAREPVPEAVSRVYTEGAISFGRGYLIPKPLDPRLLTTVAPAVARAAIESGAARYIIEDWARYEAELLERVGIGQKLVSGIINQARQDPRRIIFAEAEDYEVLKAAQIVRAQGIAEPVLLGDAGHIAELIEEHRIDGLEDCRMLDPVAERELRREYAQILYDKRHRKGVTFEDAVSFMADPNYFASAMLARGDADGLVSGRTREYPKIIRPALRVVGREDGARRVAGMYIVNSRRGVYFFADTTVNLDPGVEELVDVIALTARTVYFFNMEPVVAVVSHSNFGSARNAESERCAEAVARAKTELPNLTIDGEVQANVALDPQLLAANYPFSDLVGKRVNTLIFPSLSAGNIAYKLVGALGGAELVGPVLMGMKKPVQVLQLGSTAREIVNMVAITVVEAQRRAGE
jgi:malate dehydrogenase (oxaloacetate-decarboxylating)(NADP+)